MKDLYYISGTSHALITPQPRMRMSLFSNNTVYQKPGMISAGVGSVMNIRAKQRRA